MKILHNHLGYLTGAAKTALIAHDHNPGRFTLYQADSRSAVSEEIRAPLLVRTVTGSNQNEPQGLRSSESARGPPKLRKKSASRPIRAP